MLYNGLTAPGLTENTNSHCQTRGGQTVFNSPSIKTWQPCPLGLF